MATYTYPADKFYWGHYLNLGRHHATVILQSVVEKSQLKYNKRPLWESVNEDSINPAHELYFKGQNSSDVTLTEKLTEALKGKPEKQRYIQQELLQHFPFLYFIDIKDPKNNWEVYWNTIGNFIELLSEYRNFGNHYDHNTLESLSDEMKNNVDAIWYKALDEMVNRDACGNKIRKNDRYATEWYGETREEREEMVAHLIDWDLTENSRLTENGLSFLVALFLEKVDVYPFLSRIVSFKPAETNMDLATRDVYAHFACRLPQPKLESSDTKLDVLNELARCPTELWDALSDDDRQKFFFQLSHDSDDENPFGTSMCRSNEDRFVYFALRYLDDMEALGSARFQLYLGKLRIGKVRTKKMLGIEQERRQTKDIFTFGKLSDFLDKSAEEIFSNDLTRINTDDGISSAIEQFSPKYALEDNRIAIKFFVKPDEPNQQTALQKRLLEWFKAEKSRKDADKLDADAPDIIMSVHDILALAFYTHLYQKDRELKKPIDILRDYQKEVKKLLKTVKQEKQEYVEWRKKAKDNPNTPQEDLNLKLRISNQFDFEILQPLSRSANAKKEKEYKEKAAELQKRTAALQAKLTENGYKYLQVNELPDPVREYLLGYKLDKIKDRITDRIKKHLWETEDLIKQWKRNQENELDEKDYKPRIGEIAAWLAKDMVFLMPYQDNNLKGNRGRPTDQTFVKLQEALALYATHKDAIWIGLKDMQMIPQNKYAKTTHKHHPFLHQYNNAPKDIHSFYSGYLTKRKDWLQSLLEKDDHGKYSKLNKKYFETIEWQGKKQLSLKQSFLEQQNYWLKIDTKRLSDKEYEKILVHTPRGIFNTAIIATLRKQNIELNNAKVNKKVGDAPSITYCLDKYCKGDTQPFYTNLTRYWRLKINTEGLKELKTKQGLKECIGDLENQNNLSEEDEKQLRYLKRCLKDYPERDKAIRLSQAQDRMLLLMLHDWFGKEAGHAIDMKTLNLHKITEFLDTPYEMKVKIVYPTAETEMVKTKKGTENLQQKEAIKTITAKLPFYRYGAFRKFVKDERLRPVTKETSKNPLAYHAESGLFTWFDADTIPLVRLKEELDYYDANRHKVVESILSMEKRFFDAGIVIRPDKEYNPDGSIKKDKEGNDKKPNRTEHTCFLNVTRLADTQIEHLKMLRNKFAHNQVRYDAALDNTSTIKRVQNGQETEGCQTQPNSTNRYIEEVCLIDKKKLITAQLIKYTTEQYNAL